MTQLQVVDHLASKCRLTRAQVKDLFGELYNLASREIMSKGEFILPGFGKFVRSERKQRESRNPATGETIRIPAKTTVKFRVGKDIKKHVLGHPYADLGGDPYTDPGGDSYTDPGDPYTDP